MSFSALTTARFIQTSFIGLLIALLSTFAQAQYSAPATSTTGTYVVSWSMSMGTVKVYESQSGGAETLISGPPSGSGSVSLTRPNGVYTYKFWFCSMGGPNCALQETKTTTVSIPSSSTSSSSASSTAPGNGGPPPAPAPNSTMPVGTMSGAFRVSESGSATYSIPVAVPAGVAGVAPQLAVSYESSGGNGLVGVGANINGLGSITRCRQTLLQDGIALPITWGTNDRFCLNGQRLMLVSGTYGSSGSIYKTEIDSFVQVTAFAGTAGNPDYFEVEAKDGSKSTYGGTTESRLQGAKTITWTLSRFEDSVGNRIDYLYEGDRTTGHRIKTITYAYPVAKSSSAPAASVEFIYEDRSDVTSNYVAGGYLFKNTKRLDSITAKNGSAIYRKYYFNYNENGTSGFDNLSRLTSAQECMSDLLVSCYPKTTFAWGSKFLSFGSTPIWLNALPDVEKLKNHLFMDVDGDGRQDFVWMRSSGSNRYIEYAALSKYSSGGMVKKTFSNGANYLTYTDVQDTAEPLLQILDYNADGRQDLLIWKPFGVNSISAASWDLYLSVSDNAGGWKLSSTKITMPFTSKYMQFGDLDSDGLLDAVEASSNMATYTLKRKVGANITSNTYYEFTPTAVNKPLTGAPVFNPPPPSNPNDAPMVQVYGYESVSLGDFNGDGKLDITIPVKTYKPISPYCSADCNEQTLELYTFINTGAAFTYDANYYIFLTGTPITGWADLLAVTKIVPLDFNGDGFTDIAVKDTLNWTYRINSGKSFGSAGALTNITDSTYSVSSIGLLDINSDGYTDVIWHDKKNQQLLLRKWDMANARISTTDGYFATSKPATRTYSFADINGDGFADMLEQKLDDNDNVDFGIFSGYQDSDNLNHIYQITDGNQRKTDITYGSLAESKHYTTLQGVNTSATTDPNYCIGWTYAAPCTPPPVYALDVASFYSQINRPFGATFEAENPAPILELAGSIYAVTEVAESAPTASNPNNTNKITYHYHHARIQAGGRGYLGFEKLTTIDQQTGVRTESTYYQDWPYTGSPKSTVVKTGAGHKLSEATNVMINEKDIANSSIRRVYLDTSTEVSYSLKDNGATQGNSLQTITTDTDYDTSGNGNVVHIQTITSGSANTTVKTVTNTFSTDAWEKRMGRLLSTTTTTQRNSEAVITRQSSFEYHSRYETWPGMLKKEIIEPGTNQQVVTYVYDEVGNKKETIKTAQVKPGVNQTRKTIVEYDASKRFAKTTKDSLGNVTSGVISYHPVYGSPTEIRDANGVSTLIDYYDDGSERLRSNPTGAWSHSSRVFCNENGVVCVAGARYRVENLVSGGGKSIEYADALGRVLRSTKILFDGRESHVDTEYDNLSRVKRQSTAYTMGETPYWTVFDTYDLLGRPTKVTAPDGTVTTTTYDGYKTTVIADANGKALKREEERNSLGHLIKVTDNLGGIITYGYDALGNLTSATTTASGTTVRVRMCYDKLGRKFAMHDPDKGGFLGNPNTMCTTLEPLLTQPADNKQLGWWYYRYNDFGELIEQTDTKKQITVMDYDELGRMKTRTDNFSNGTVDAHTRWYYDKNIGEATAQLKNQFKLMAVVTSYGSISENCSGSNYCQTYLYDNTSRLTDTATYLPNHTVGYISTVKYDSIGRVYETRDVLNGLVGNSGTTTIFNNYGYASEVRDLASGDVLQKTMAVNSRGQVTEEWRNNGGAGIVTYQYDDKTGAMKNQKASIAGGLFPIQDVTYEWDAVGNLKSRWNQSSNVGRTAKKNLQESFCYDGLNRLIKSYVGTLVGSCSLSAASQDIEYDGLGNITRKTDVGTYTYSGKGPHAVTSTTNDGAYTYDNNGNQTGGASRTIAYSSYDQPTRITKGTTVTEFGYGPDRSRWQRIDTKNSQRTLTQYLGNVERIDVEGSNIVEWKRYIAGAIYTVRTTAVQSGGSINYSVQRTDKSFTYNDHLGSLDVVVNNVGQVTHTASFDAWGNRRNAENWTSAFAASTLALTNYTQPITQRGYTGHEMLDDTGLIHMNGRIFDPRLARFMQADPFIQAATNTQSYNRYAYVMNNPLNMTDPSGFFWKKLWKELKPFVSTLVAIGVSYFTGGVMLAGILGGGIGAAVNGGNILQGMLFGAFTGALGGVGGWEGFLVRGALGGMQSVMAGGKFGHGFFAAGIGGLGGGNTPDFTGFLRSAVLGGIATEITGGKFANGAATAAFSYAMTWAASKYSAGGGNSEEVDVQGIDSRGKRLDFLKTKFGKLITTDKNGNMELVADVAYDTSEKNTAEDFVESVNGSWTEGKKGKEVTLTVRLRLVDTGTADIKIVSWNTLASVSPSKKYQESINSQCLNKSCSIGALGYAYFSEYPAYHGMHELFHLLGFKGHANTGVLKVGGRPSDLNDRDLGMLRHAYFDY